MREQSPEWKYVVILEQKDKSTAKMQCCFCDKVFTGGALHIREHLSGTGNVMIKACGKVPDDVAEIMRKMLKEKNDAKINKRKQQVLDEATSNKLAKPECSGFSQSTIPAMFNNKEAVDASLVVSITGIKSFPPGGENAREE